MPFSELEQRTATAYYLRAGRSFSDIENLIFILKSIVKFDTAS